MPSSRLSAGGRWLVGGKHKARSGPTHQADKRGRRSSRRHEDPEKTSSNGEEDEDKDARGFTARSLCGGRGQAISIATLGIICLYQLIISNRIASTSSSFEEGLHSSYSGLRSASPRSKMGLEPPPRRRPVPAAAPDDLTGTRPEGGPKDIDPSLPQEHEQLDADPEAMALPDTASSSSSSSSAAAEEEAEEEGQLEAADAASAEGSAKQSAPSSLRASAAASIAAATGAASGRRCSHLPGYANDRIPISGAAEFQDFKSSDLCLKACRAVASCNCWSWKDDGYCRVGQARTCTQTGSADNARWTYGSCGTGPLNDDGEIPVPVRGGAFDVNPPGSETGQLQQSYSSSSTTPTICKSSPPPVTRLEKEAAADAVVPVVIICYARPQYLRRSLDSLFAVQRSKKQFPISASQDGDNQEVESMLEQEVVSGRLAQHLRYQPTISSQVKKTGSPRAGYQRLAGHYKWALDQFLGPSSHYEQLIILEEDLEVAPDFFSYFQATLPYLKADPCLFCVSAWNDNGRSSLANDAKAIYRSDFFPGLGWLLLKSFWLELRETWPNEYWDDFVRKSSTRKGRHCLRPEVSRTFTFGEVGVSRGQFYKTHLKHIKLNQENVDWLDLDLTYIASADRFDSWLSKEISMADVVTLEDIQRLSSSASPKAYAMMFKESNWKRISKHFGLAEDIKDGVYRGSYRSVIPFTWQGKHRIYLLRDWPLLRGLPR